MDKPGHVSHIRQVQLNLVIGPFGLVELLQTLPKPRDFHAHHAVLGGIEVLRPSQCLDRDVVLLNKACPPLGMLLADVPENRRQVGSANESPRLQNRLEFRLLLGRATRVFRIAPAGDGVTVNAHRVHLA